MEREKKDLISFTITTFLIFTLIQTGISISDIGTSWYGKDNVLNDTTTGDLGLFRIVKLVNTYTGAPDNRSELIDDSLNITRPEDADSSDIVASILAIPSTLGQLGLTLIYVTVDYMSLGLYIMSWGQTYVAQGSYIGSMLVQSIGFLLIVWQLYYLSRVLKFMMGRS